MKTWQKLMDVMREKLGIETEAAAMDYLQNHGLISDNCVHLKDVPPADITAAIERLPEGREESQ